MKIYTSYFYQVRYFKPHQIPVSTADWDPKWFHENMNQNHVWKDKNGVWNGVRIELLNPSHVCTQLPPECVYCIKGNRHPESCGFLKDYRDGLKNRLDFEELMCFLTGIADYFKQLEHFSEEPEIMLLVHEAPTVLCSERVPIQELFLSHNMQVEEWDRHKHNITLV